MHSDVGGRLGAADSESLLDECCPPIKKAMLTDFKLQSGMAHGRRVGAKGSRGSDHLDLMQGKPFDPPP